MAKDSSILRDYLSKAFRWRRGRQGTGYDKLMILTGRWPVSFDCYLLRYPEGSEIPPHRDSVTAGRHYRLNLVLKPARCGGQFLCNSAIVDTAWLKIFRPDQAEHSVTKVIEGSRYVLSIGWLVGAHDG